MNRRSFLKLLLGTSATLALPWQASQEEPKVDIKFYTKQHDIDYILVTSVKLEKAIEFISRVVDEDCSVALITKGTGIFQNVHFAPNIRFLRKMAANEKVQVEIYPPYPYRTVYPPSRYWYYGEPVNQRMLSTKHTAGKQPKTCVEITEMIAQMLT